MAHNKNWNILVWNIRGINSDDKLLAIRNAINQSGCNAICLQETKRMHFDMSFIRSFCPKRFDKFLFVPSRGASGGIITIWNSSVLEGTLVFSDIFAIGVSFTSKLSGQVWSLYNIYGPCRGDDRQKFIDWLCDLDIPDDDDWLLVGDYNFIRSTQNCNKPGGDNNDILLFNDIIRSQELIEIPLKGRSFTWSNMQDDPLLEQLDWFLSSNHWTQSFPNTTVTSLGKPVSDHCPCVVNIATSIPKSKKFCFESFWTNHPGFIDTVAASWNKSCHAKNSAALICRKLKNLRYDLKAWSKGISRLSVLIQNCNWALTELDGLEDQRPLSIPEANSVELLKPTY